MDFSKIKNLVGNFFSEKNKGGGSAGGAQSIAASAGSLFDTVAETKSDPSDALGQQQAAVRNKITDAAIKSGNPIAMGVGVGAKALDALGAATGLTVDNIDTEASSRFGIKGGFNNVVGYIPGVQMLAGAFAKSTNEADAISQETRDIYGAYSGAGADLDAVQKLGGKRVLGKRKRNQINAAIDEANETNAKMHDISVTNTYRKQSDYGNDLLQQNLNRYAGSNYMNNQIGKFGMKLVSLNDARRILEMRNQTNIPTFEQGGKMNVIPEGARHSRLNHLDEVHDDFKDITKKGIPVVVPTEDGKLEQIAEVERGEIIFSYDVTKQLEELMQDGSDEAAIKAGKLLTKEIIKNTEDKTEEYL